MAKKHDLVLEKVLEKIEISNEKKEFLNKVSSKFILKLNKRIKKLKLDVEPFIGGSFAKKTLIEKQNQDIDLFLRFEKKYKDPSKLTKKILKGFGAKKIHGSRDYFQLKINNSLKIEIVPVRKIRKVNEAENITDLSYFHVKYTNKKIKSKKILNEIKLAKSFCRANKTYGAESYINGFSGYTLELLIYHYKSFVKMLQELAKAKDKIIIDIEKQYKNKKEIMYNLNGAKLDSPIVLIDPTYKTRNVAAAISNITFEKFQKSAKEFLKNPKEDFFKIKKFSIKDFTKDYPSQKVLIFKTQTKKQEGDIAATKLLKFFNHFKKEISRYFKIENSHFEYLKDKKSLNVLILEPKKKIILSGPLEGDKGNIEKFKSKHKNIFLKEGKYHTEKILSLTPKEFLKIFKKKEKRKIKEMSINKINLN